MNDYESLLDGTSVSRDELRARYRTPAVRWNMVTSIDGAATVDGRVGPLTDPADQLHMDIARSAADVVVIGAGTLRNEGYDGFRVSDEAVAWRREWGLPDHPALVIVSRSLLLDPESSLLARAPRRPMIITNPKAPAARIEALRDVADVEITDTSVGGNIIGLTRKTFGDHVLTEGGPALLATLLTDDSVTEALLSISPTVAGGTGSRIVRPMPVITTGATLIQLLRADSLLLAHYRLTTVSKTTIVS